MKKTLVILLLVCLACSLCSCKETEAIKEKLADDYYIEEIDKFTLLRNYAEPLQIHVDAGYIDEAFSVISKDYSSLAFVVDCSSTSSAKKVVYCIEQQMDRLIDRFGDSVKLYSDKDLVIVGYNQCVKDIKAAYKDDSFKSTLGSVLIIYLVIAAICGFITKCLYAAKGYEYNYFLGLCLGPWGVIKAISASPYAAKESIIKSAVTDTAPPVPSPNNTPPNGWQCSCGRTNPRFSLACSCGLRKGALSAPKFDPTTEKNTIEIIKEYKALYDSGVISKEALDAKVQQLLGN